MRKIKKEHLSKVRELDKPSIKSIMEELGVSNSFARTYKDIVQNKLLDNPREGVLVVGDLHAPFIREGYLEFCKRIYDKHNLERVVFIGDIIDNHYSSFHDTDPDGHGAGEELDRARKQISEWYKTFPDADVLLGNHCFSAETQLLTRGGWIDGVDLKSDTEIATLNPATRELEWQVPTARIKYRYDGDMVEIKNRSVNQLVTPNHRVAYYNERSGDLSYRTAESCFDVSRVNIPCSSENLKGDYGGLSDDEIRLLGWVFSDGGISNKRLNIYQSKLDGIADIEDVLGKLGVKYSLRKRDRDITHICGKELKSKPLTAHEYSFRYDAILPYIKDRNILPSVLDDISRRQFDIFLDTFNLADGTNYGDGRVINSKCINGSFDMLTQLQILCVKNGLRAKIVEYRPNNFRLNVAERKSSMVDKSGITKVPYSGEVWCVEVDNTNLFTRRDGAVTISGNCLLSNRKAFNAGLSKQWIRPLSEVLDTTNWRYHEQLSIDNVLYVHGTGRKARQRAKQDIISVVQGHYHSESYVEYYVGRNAKYFALQVGCGIDDKSYAFAYGKHFAKSHINVGVVKDKGKLAFLEYMDL